LYLKELKITIFCISLIFSQNLEFLEVPLIKSGDEVGLDKDSEKHFGNGLLVPQATISNGLLAFAQIDFNLSSQ
jgi:hypothetical protein